MSTTKESEHKDLKKENIKSNTKTNLKSENEEIANKPSKNYNVMSTGEYAEKFRWWWYQQQCMHQMNMASYQFLYHLHLLATYNYFNQLRSVQPPLPHPTNSTTTSANTHPPRQDIRGFLVI